MKGHGVYFLTWMTTHTHTHTLTHTHTHTHAHTHTHTHTHTHSGYLEGHFFSWSSVHTDPADCYNLHYKVMEQGLDVYLCGVVCVYDQLLSC